MKFRILSAAMLLFALGATVSHAAVKSEFGLNAGLAMPTGDFSDAAGAGFFGGGTYTYHVSEMLGIGGDINYQKFGKKDVEFFGDTYSSEASDVQYGAHGKYYFPMASSEAPYLKVGLGMYSTSVKASGGGLSSTASDTNFGFNFGAGADWKMNDKTSWGIEALYHIIQSEGDSANLFTVGVRYNWLLN